ncbi:MAG TPA: substrate-binding domain-containing protein [Planctomycetota bacterium]|nr:substrate-binding domain-containing protein [Planctomycetota bacterium]
MSLRNILLIISLLLSVLIGTAMAQRGVAAGGDAKAANRKLIIGLSLDTLKEERWQNDRDRFVSKAKELGADVAVSSANSDDAVQMKDVESLIAQGVDVLVIVPHDGIAMAKAVDKAKAAGIPVMAYDRLIRDCDLDIYTSFDNEDVGRQQARFLVAKLGGKDAKGSIVRIYGAPTDNNARQFKAGQDEILKPYIDSKAITVVHEDWAEDWKPENAKRILQAAISKGAPFAAVLATNDGTAGGAIQALIEEKRTGIIVTGQDAELPACQRIAAGTQSMTIYKPLHLLAEGAAELTVRMARRQVVVANGTVDNGKGKIPAVLHQVVTVDADNLKDTVIKDGHLKEADVYKGAAK